MNDASPATQEFESESVNKAAESRRARSTRFSESAWESIERTTTEHGMIAAEFVRHTALGIASGQHGHAPGPLPSQ